MTLVEAVVAGSGLLGLVVAPVAALALGHGWLVVCLAAPGGFVLGVLVGGGAWEAVEQWAIWRERRGSAAGKESE